MMRAWGRGFADSFEKGQARALAPRALAGVGRVGGNLPVGVEAAEVVEPDDIVEFEGRPEAGDPPGIAGAGLVLPIVERIAPELAERGEIIRRHAGHRPWPAGGIELKNGAVPPGVGAVQRDKDRHVADDADAALRGVAAQARPLAEEDVLIKNVPGPRPVARGRGG